MNHVFYVDDEPALLDIGKLFLERSGDFCVDTITSAPAALSRMQSMKYDAIISDYQMPGMDGIEFLKQVRHSGNTIPFILFTGRGREEIVIQALNEGADFYLQKGGDPRSQFVELEYKIRIAVDRRRTTDELIRKNDELHIAYERLTGTEEELRQNYDELSRNEQELRASEQKFRNVVEVQTEFICRFLPDGTHVFVNDAYCRYFNKKHEELVGKRFAPHIPAEDRKALREFFSSLTKDHPVAEIRHRIIMPDGQVRWQQWSDRAIFDANGSIIEYQSVGRDVSDIVKAEESLRESEEKYRQFFRTSRDCIFITSNDGSWIDFNDAAIELFGYPNGQRLKDVKIPDLYANPEDREKHIRIIEEHGYTKEYPVNLRKKDGTIIPTLITSVASYDAKGNVAGFQGTIRDISAQKQAEDALLRKNDDLSAAYEELTATEEELRQNYEELSRKEQDLYSAALYPMQNPLPVLRADDQGVLIYANPASSHILESWNTHLHAPLPEHIRHHVTEALAQRSPHATEEVCEPDTFSIMFAPICDQGYVNLYFSNITDYKHAETKIRESEVFNREVINGAKEGIIVYDRELRITLWNRFMEVLTGMPASAVLGKNAIDLFPFHRATGVEQMLNDAVSGVTGVSDDFHFTVQETGKSGWVKGIYSPHYDAHGSIIGVIGIIQDITERRKAEEVLRESEEKYRDIFNNTNDAIQIIELDEKGNAGKFIDVNEMTCRMLQYTRDKLLQMSLSDLEMTYSSKPIDMVEQELKTAGSSTFETEMVRKDGVHIPVEVSVHPVILQGWHVCISVVRDITDRKATGHSLEMANKKLNLLMEITRHDTLNQLLVLRGYLDLAKDLTGNPTANEYIMRGEDAVRTIHAQISFTRDYQGIGVKTPEWQNISEIISRVQRAFLLANVVVNNTCNDLEVFADPLLEKVFFNLVDNALKYGGNNLNTIGISCVENSVDDSFTIICEDNGVGIAPEDKQRLFERGYGKNTGLGLFLAREILSITDITITETGEPGNGARFEITVPKGAYHFTATQ